MNFSFIKEVRKQKKIYQYQLAEKVGISQAYLTQIEKGQKTNPSFDIVVRICNELDLELRILYKND